jgi:biopolymer transport protein ExbB/TolQ
MLTEKIFGIAQNGAEGILWLLLFLSVLSISIIIERYWTLKSYKTQSDKVRNQLLEALKSNNLGDIEDMSKDKETLEGRVLSHFFKHIKENGVNGVEEIINSHIIFERQKMEKSLNFLATLGANAPFIGLLGTVLGIMKAFNDLGVTQGISQASGASIMTGIAEALVATAVGLFVAIPAVIAYNHYQKQVRHIIQNLEGLKELCLAYAKKKV